MLFANFINETNPECLYCHNKIKGFFDKNLRHLPCKKCDEVFIINESQRLFGFSCKSLVCGVSLKDETLFVTTKKSATINLISVPYFYLNFYDRKSLHNKLKTYIAFS
jgi:hypothetical protein